MFISILKLEDLAKFVILYKLSNFYIGAWFFKNLYLNPEQTRAADNEHKMFNIALRIETMDRGGPGGLLEPIKDLGVPPNTPP